MKKPKQLVTIHTVKTPSGEAREQAYPGGPQPFGLNKNTRRIRKEEKNAQR